MKQLIEFDLEDGGTIVVEVEEPDHGVGPAARPGEIAEKAGETFEKALSKIKPVVAALIAKVRELAEPPDEVGLEFGCKFNAKAGVVLASAATEANFKVSLTWKREPSKVR